MYTMQSAITVFYKYFDRNYTIAPFEYEFEFEGT